VEGGDQVGRPAGPEEMAAAVAGRPCRVGWRNCAIDGTGDFRLGQEVAAVVSDDLLHSIGGEHDTRVGF